MRPTSSTCGSGSGSRARRKPSTCAISSDTGPVIDAASAAAGGPQSCSASIPEPVSPETGEPRNGRNAPGRNLVPNTRPTPS